MAARDAALLETVLFVAALVALSFVGSVTKSRSKAYRVLPSFLFCSLRAPSSFRGRPRWATGKITLEMRAISSGNH